MKFDVKDRLLLLSILPKETNFITLKIIKNLQTELSFSEEEIKKYEFANSNGLTKWNAEKDENKDINIGEKASDIIIESLKKLDSENKLTMDFMSLYEKFVK